MNSALWIWYWGAVLVACVEFALLLYFMVRYVDWRGFTLDFIPSLVTIVVICAIAALIWPIAAIISAGILILLGPLPPE